MTRFTFSIQKICIVYYSCLFCLAVLECVKPDIDQIASIIYCMNANSKDDR